MYSVLFDSTRKEFFFCKIPEKERQRHMYLFTSATYYRAVVWFSNPEGVKLEFWAQLSWDLGWMNLASAPKTIILCQKTGAIWFYLKNLKRETNSYNFGFRCLMFSKNVPNLLPSKPKRTKDLEIFIHTKMELRLNLFITELS